MIYNFEMLNVPFANGAISTEIAPFPDWNRGLGIAFEQSEGKPEMKGLNGLFQVLTTSVLYLKQRGIAEWDSTLEYPVNAFVVDGARLYKSKRVNTNKQPSTSQLDWDIWASISDISVSTNGNLKKTFAADGSMTLEVQTATNSQRGVVRFATAVEVANRSNAQAAVRPSDIPQPSMVPDATTSTKGIVRQATSAEVANKSNVNAYITPSNASAIAQTTDLGVGQKWQNVTSSRNSGTTYTNNTGKPIQVAAVIFDAPGITSGATATVDGVLVFNMSNPPQGSTTISFIVPSGSSYSINFQSNTLQHWAELR